MSEQAHFVVSNGHGRYFEWWPCGATWTWTGCLHWHVFPSLQAARDAVSEARPELRAEVAYIVELANADHHEPIRHDAGEAVTA